VRPDTIQTGGGSVLVRETRPVAREHPASLLCSVARGWAAELWRAGDCWFWQVLRSLWSMVVAVARRSVLVAMSASGGSSAVERRYPSRPGQHRSKQSCANRSKRFCGFATEEGYGFVGGMMCVKCSVRLRRGRSFCASSLAANQIKIKFPVYGK
jgi:hypothetical protein